MLRDFWCFYSGTRSSDSGDVADLDPVLLVSGIAGSILNSKSKKFGFETRVWVRILLADLEFKKKLFSIYNPKTGYTEVLDDSSEIVVPQDDHGLYAIDILDPSPKFGPSPIAVVACRGLVTDFTPASTGGYNATFVSDILAEPKGMISEP
ncbi:phospholipase A(1) LCAT3-like [Forsythia ovata]|uniref:Phospholipase A(1) LCAT3-like n=1 Tax=Forsythia ovata TaxID=205694 RepID=A0ABD1WLL2_9LAMI